MSTTIKDLVMKVLTLVWIKICDIKENDLPVLMGRVKKLIFWFAIIGLIALGLFIGGVVGHGKGLMFFSDMALIVMVLLAYWAPSFIMSVFAGVSGAAAGMIGHDKVKDAAAEIKNLEGEVRKLVTPLVLLAAVLAFINAYIQLNGFGCVTSELFYVIISAVVAITILSTFFTRPKFIRLLPIIIMMGSLIGSLTMWYAKKSDDPLACVLNNTVQAISLPMQASSAKYYGVARNSSKLYIASVEEGTITGVASDDSLTQGKVVQVLDRKAKRFDNDLFVKIRLKEGNSYTGGKVRWTQIENLEIFQGTVEPGKYALVKKSSKFLWWGNNSWKIYFIADTINISLVPREMLFSFSGVKTRELSINPVNMPGVDSLVPVAVNCELYNAGYTNMTLKAAAGTMVILSTRKATEKEKTVCTDWYLRQQASLQNVAPTVPTVAPNAEETDSTETEND